MAGKGALLALAVPLLNPRVGAHRREDVLEVLAYLVALALDLLAAVEIQIALVAVLGLVLVGEAGIEWGRLRFVRHLLAGCWSRSVGHTRKSTKFQRKYRQLNFGVECVCVCVRVLCKHPPHPHGKIPGVSDGDLNKC